MTTFENHSFVGDVLRARDFVGATFVNCDFRGVDCTDARFDGAKFSDCDLTDAILRGANLSSTWFTGGSLAVADLEGAELGGAKFYRVNLDGVKAANVRAGKLELVNASAVASRWQNGFFRNATIISTPMPAAVLDDTNLAGAKFSHCDLRGASLERAHLDRTRFNDCKVSGLRGVPAEPWSIRAMNLDVAGEEKGLLEIWRELRGDDPRANPCPLSRPREDTDGLVSYLITEGDPSIESQLDPHSMVFPVEAPWFTKASIVGVPSREPVRMIYVGLFGELEGALLEGAPDELTRVAKAAGVSIGDAIDATQYARFSYHVTIGAKKVAAWTDAEAQATPDGWRVCATTRWGDHIAKATVDISREGAVKIEEREL